MDQDDPEQRIAELERQLAESQAATGSDRGGDRSASPLLTAGTTSRTPLTAADVRKVAFNKPPIGTRGYNEDEVDAFLDLVEQWLSNPSGDSLTAGDVHRMHFGRPPIGKRDYNEDEVDEFLQLVEAHCAD